MPDIVFMGTPEFAVPSMAYLLKAGIHISLLVCQPDRKKGRGQKVQFPPTKQFALDHHIEVFQPVSVRTPDVIQKLKEKQPAFCVVIAYGKILPKEILAVPEKGCLNVHASLLPQWRGAAPIQFALLNGDEQTGVCTMLIDEGMDSGDILLSRTTPIDADECADTLSERLSLMGAELIVETIQRFDGIQPLRQEHDQATYARLLKKEDRRICWDEIAPAVYNRFRALSPSPGVFTEFRGQRLMIKSMRLSTDQTLPEKPGTITAISPAGVTVACSKGAVSILTCQPENKKPVSAGDWINGYQVKNGELLGGKAL
ncbi:methionyl-tRNA formyltransferase [bacterium]|nr:methionyl-tRNA formyltransferase [bacterium]